MTQIVHNNKRETRTKRTACVHRLMRTRSERRYAECGATTAPGVLTLTDATIADY
jgi:hypothetical protein